MTNTDEDEATIAENFTVYDFYNLVIRAKDQEKNSNCSVLRYKIEAMIGCRIIFDKE
jgi:hypothetical protein